MTLKDDAVAESDTVSKDTSGDAKVSPVPIAAGGELLEDTDTINKGSKGEEAREEVFTEYKTMWQLSSYHEGEGIDVFYAPALLDHIQPVRTQ